MLVYYGYALPLSLRIGRGFYEDGIWADGGFMPYSRIGGMTWREGEQVTLVMIYRMRAFARRAGGARAATTAPPAACCATRSPRTTSTSPARRSTWACTTSGRTCETGCTAWLGSCRLSERRRAVSRTCAEPGAVSRRAVHRQRARSSQPIGPLPSPSGRRASRAASARRTPGWRPPSGRTATSRARRSRRTRQSTRSGSGSGGAGFMRPPRAASSRSSR